MKVYQFPARQVTRPHFCAGCGERIPADKPGFWVYCSRCYGYGMFRKAVESFRKVRQ